MSLLTKTLSVNVANQNISYYENLGYKIPRHMDKQGKLRVKQGTKIIVNVRDLSNSSNELVDVECDHCGKIYKVSYSSYNHCNHNGLYYCNTCAHSLFCSGENSSNWNPILTDEDRKNGRNYPEYIDFVKKVFARDEYTCKCCGRKINSDGEIHHLNGYNWDILGRTSVKNGVCLCGNCHKSFHSKYGYGDNTKEQFEDFIGNSVCELEKYNGILPIKRKVIVYETKEIFESVNDCANKIGSSDTGIYSCCNHKESEFIRKYKNGSINTVVNRNLTVKGYHIFWLDEYEQLKESELQRFLNRTDKKCRRVVCLTTDKIFKSMTDAVNEYNLKFYDGIRLCCKKKQSYSGIHPLTGEKLKWMYYEDYLESTAS